MAKDSKALIAASLDELTLHGLMAQQAHKLDEAAKEIRALFEQYDCADFNAAFKAFTDNKTNSKEFRSKRDALIEQLKQIVATMDAIKDAQADAAAGG